MARASGRGALRNIALIFGLLAVVSALLYALAGPSNGFRWLLVIGTWTNLVLVLRQRRNV